MLRKRSKSEGKISHKITDIDGIKFHSKLESKRYEYLKKKKENGGILDFSLQPSFVLQDSYIVINGESISSSDVNFKKLKTQYKSETIRAIKYIGDFKVIYPDGTIVIEDTKGISTPEFEIKRKLFMFKYPNLQLKVLSMYKNEWVDFYENEKRKRLVKKQKKDKLK